MTFNRTIILFLTVFLSAVFHTDQLANALDSRSNLNPQKLPQNTSDKSPSVPASKMVSNTPRKGAGEKIYTVKPGDNLRKILIRGFGMSNHQVEAMIPEIKRRNQLEDARRLKIGMRIIIPFPVNNKSNIRPARNAKHAPDPENDQLKIARLAWENLLPAKKLTHDPLSIGEGNYRLNLALDRFPIFPAADNGKIIVETGDRLSPIVKALIQDHDPGIRFVKYTPQNNKRFFADLLAAAWFYSVQENFSIAFGDDPKLIVSSDFKIENNANSDLQQGIFLLNIGPQQWNFPPLLSDYLAKLGFRVIDLYPSGHHKYIRTDSRIHVITDREPIAVADRLMSALDLRFEQNRAINLINMDVRGVSLRFIADRYFEKNGERFVVSVFNGDMEHNTLIQLLESQRYHVIALSPKEDFRSIAGKFLAQLHLESPYAMQDLITSKELSYNIQMSGIMVNPSDKRGKLFLTNSHPDNFICELLEFSGYTIIGRKISTQAQMKE